MKGNNYMDAHFVSNTIGERRLWLKLIGSFPIKSTFLKSILWEEEFKKKNNMMQSGKNYTCSLFLLTAVFCTSSCFCLADNWSTEHAAVLLPWTQSVHRAAATGEHIHWELLSISLQQTGVKVCVKTCLSCLKVAKVVFNFYHSD